MEVCPKLISNSLPMRPASPRLSSYPSRLRVRGPGMVGRAGAQPERPKFGQNGIRPRSGRVTRQALIDR